MNEQAARCLYTGLVTDTGRFRFRSVSSKTMRTAGELLDKDINIEFYFNGFKPYGDNALFEIEKYAYFSKAA